MAAELHHPSELNLSYRMTAAKLIPFGVSAANFAGSATTVDRWRTVAELVAVQRALANNVLSCADLASIVTTSNTELFLADNTGRSPD